jgi:DNA helicase IV
MGSHPELEAEQAYIDHAYECLEASRRSATRLQDTLEVGKGGTEQARWEREVFQGNILNRLSQLHLGDASLCFGRIDRLPEVGGESFHVGRLAVADENQEPLVVDWRAPVAEPFYRATGREPMGLRRRRHFATRGRTLLSMEDEVFGELEGVTTNGRAVGEGGDSAISGYGALIAALESSRSGRLGDIVATIQGEQDEIIRAPLPGVLVVQGGPGTGKTVVALHRAAYLLYTYRFPLEGQGVLVIGPNRLFLGYIEQVLPSLGEAGVELAVLADLIPENRVRGRDAGLVARVKGDLRMVSVLRRAVQDRQRRLRARLEVGYGLTVLRLSVEQSDRIVREARRRFRNHNAGRRFVERSFFEALAASSRLAPDPDDVRRQLRSETVVREALDWMWPVLTPSQLLHDLFGSRALLRSAGRRHLSDDEAAALVRSRSDSADEVTWTNDDVPLLDEARALLGPLPRRKKQPAGQDDEVRTYGHIVVDEAQDLSPMQLRVLTRRSLNGSMTIVGDIAQATGAWAHDDWESVLEHLPDRRPSQRAELTVGYRIPAANMVLAAKVLSVAAPDLKAPSSVREGDSDPRLEAVSHGDRLVDEVVRLVREECDAVGQGSVGIICPASLTSAVAAALEDAGIEHGSADRHGLEQQVTVVPVGLVKGLELDASIVVEPSAIVREEPQGMRSLYVALTRATKRLTLVHAEALPDVLQE